VKRRGTERLHFYTFSSSLNLHGIKSQSSSICPSSNNNNNNNNKDQFVNIVKSHEGTQPNMNSIIKTAAKITEELSQPNEKSDTKLGIQHTKARLVQCLKKK